MCMETNNAEDLKNNKLNSEDFAKKLWEESWTYIKNVVDIVREPVLILDKDFSVMTANESFYRTFQVDSKDTENKIVYDLGNGQWNIPALRKLLEDILPKNKFFKGFEVEHEFPVIGHKIMILNARQIYSGLVKKGVTSEIFPPIILLAMEDITDLMGVAKTIAGHTNILEAKLTAETKKMKIHIGRLEREIVELKKMPV